MAEAKKVNRYEIKIEGIASYPHLNTKRPNFNGTKDEYSVQLYLTAEKTKALATKLKEVLAEDQTATEMNQAKKLVPAQLKGVTFAELNRPIQQNDGKQAEYFPVAEYPAFITLKSAQNIKLLDKTSGEVELWDDFKAPIQGGDRIAVNFNIGKGYHKAMKDTSGYPLYLNGAILLERGVIEGISGSTDIEAGEDL